MYGNPLSQKKSFTKKELTFLTLISVVAFLHWWGYEQYLKDYDW